MIPSSWSNSARAPVGKILVRPKSLESIRHGLYLPTAYVEHTRTAVGTVVDIHPTCAQQVDEIDFAVGDNVLLSAAGGQMIVFGLRRTDESELWIYSPRAVRLVFEKPVEIANEPDSHLKGQQELRAKMPTVDPRFTEGDPQGPR